MNNTIPEAFRFFKTPTSHGQILILYYRNFNLLNLIRLNNTINYTLKLHFNLSTTQFNKKGKAIPITGLCGPEGG